LGRNEKGVAEQVLVPHQFGPFGSESDADVILEFIVERHDAVAMNRARKWSIKD